jgi:hypothetical protein
LAPTLQKAMGLEPSGEVDGRVLESAFQKSWLSQPERMSIAA